MRLVRRAEYFALRSLTILVHGIVNRATEIPHGNDCLMFLRGQNDERVIEVGVSAAHDRCPIPRRNPF
jgi:hypothetical protein